MTFAELKKVCCFTCTVVLKKHKQNPCAGFEFIRVIPGSTLSAEKEYDNFNIESIKDADGVIEIYFDHLQK